MCTLTNLAGGDISTKYFTLVGGAPTSLPHLPETIPKDNFQQVKQYRIMPCLPRAISVLQILLFYYKIGGKDLLLLCLFFNLQVFLLL